MSIKYDPEPKTKAACLFQDHVAENPSRWELENLVEQAVKDGEW